MAEVLHRQAQYDAMVADPDREVAVTRADGSPEDGGLHKIVVVGGGAAGLELVTRLGDRLGRRRRAGVTLVESARTHLWKPLLHEVAAGSIDPGEYEVNYLAQAHWQLSIALKKKGQAAASLEARKKAEQLDPRLKRNQP